MTEQDIQKLGFKKSKSYTHDEFNTNRYKLGFLEVEFTYLETQIVDIDVTIEEVNCLPINYHELSVLNLVLNKQLV